MGSEQQVTKTGMGCGSFFAALLGLLFIYMKLTDVIDWSWWWVLAPLWVPAVVIAVVLVFWIALLIIVVIREQ